MDFAIDQQQFLQGYLPIVILTNYAETRNLPPATARLIMTGPGFVTKDNAADVIALAARGLSADPPARAAPAGPRARRPRQLCRRASCHGHHDVSGRARPSGCARPRSPSRLLGRPELGALPAPSWSSSSSRLVAGDSGLFSRHGHRQLPRGVGPARHPRHRRRAADDRRRVRPVGRLDDRLRRHRHRASPSTEWGWPIWVADRCSPSPSPSLVGCVNGLHAWYAPACRPSSSRSPALFILRGLTLGLTRRSPAAPRSPASQGERARLAGAALRRPVVQPGSSTGSAGIGLIGRAADGAAGRPGHSGVGRSGGSG